MVREVIMNKPTNQNTVWHEPSIYRTGICMIFFVISSIRFPLFIKIPYWQFISEMKFSSP
jgi:hypothetical protein